MEFTKITDSLQKFKESESYWKLVDGLMRQFVDTTNISLSKHKHKHNLRAHPHTMSQGLIDDFAYNLINEWDKFKQKSEMEPRESNPCIYISGSIFPENKNDANSSSTTPFNQFINGSLEQEASKFTFNGLVESHDITFNKNKHKYQYLSDNNMTKKQRYDDNNGNNDNDNGGDSGGNSNNNGEAEYKGNYVMRKILSTME